MSKITDLFVDDSADSSMLWHTRERKQDEGLHSQAAENIDVKTAGHDDVIDGKYVISPEEKDEDRVLASSSKKHGIIPF